MNQPALLSHVLRASYVLSHALRPAVILSLVLQSEFGSSEGQVGLSQPAPLVAADRHVHLEARHVRARQGNAQMAFGPRT